MKKETDDFLTRHCRTLDKYFEEGVQLLGHVLILKADGSFDVKCRWEINKADYHWLGSHELTRDERRAKYKLAKQERDRIRAERRWNQLMS